MFRVKTVSGEKVFFFCTSLGSFRVLWYLVLGGSACLEVILSSGSGSSCFSVVGVYVFEKSYLQEVVVVT